MSQDGTRKRMEEGRLYFPGDTDILKEQEQYMELLYDYNATRPGEKENRPCTVTGEESMCSWGIWSMRIST